MISAYSYLNSVSYYVPSEMRNMLIDRLYVLRNILVRSKWKGKRVFHVDTHILS